MDFEDILKDVGGFGRYQKTLVIVFLIPFFVVHPWFLLNTIFTTSTPDHWCYVPEISASNLTLDVQKRLIRPSSDPSCLMYDVNYSMILLSGNLTVDESWPTKHCIHGWQYDKKDYDATASTRWNMVCNDSKYASDVIALAFFGNLFGAPFYSFLCDRVGRKPIVFLLSAIIAVTEIGSVLSPNFVVFLVLRGINGTAMSPIYGTGYIILLELVSPDIRSRINGLATVFWSIGLSLLPLIAWLTRDWIRLSIVTSSAAVGLLLYWKLLSESPSWLISRGRYDEAHAIMVKVSKGNRRKAHEGNHLMQKIVKLGEKIKKENAEVTDSPLDLLKFPTLRKRFLLVTIAWMGTSLPFYGLQINIRNLAGSEFLNSFLMSIVDIPSQFVGWYCLERFGRRWCGVVAFAVSTSACLLPVVFPPEFTEITLIASMLAKCSSGVTFMTVYQQCPELIPTSLRSLGVGLASTIGTSTVILVPYIVYLGKYGTYVPFLIFSTVACISGICASFLPESLNKSLSQTVTDSENFENNFRYFSCHRYKRSKYDSEAVESCQIPVTLSADELSSSVENPDMNAPCADIPVLKKHSIKSESYAESTLHM